jgi:5'-3' exonuclease
VSADVPPLADEPGRRDRLMLVDTPSLYFRAFHGVPRSVTAPDGTPVNAVRGLLDILTGDRDLFQLVRDDAGVRVRYSVERFAVVDESAVTARYGIPGRAYGDFAVLRGDPSDGLPGVPGIGAKTAAALLVRFGSLAAVLAALDAGQESGFPAGARRRLAAARDYLGAARTVVRVVTDVPLPQLRAELPTVPADPERVLAMSERWGLAGSCTRLVRALSGGGRAGSARPRGEDEGGPHDRRSEAAALSGGGRAGSARPRGEDEGGPHDRRSD